MSAAKPDSRLKVVLDTNVYFSAFNSTRGVPFELWRRAVEREYELLISPAIIREMADVLRMDLAWPESEIIAQLKLVVRVAKIVEPTFTLDVIAADPDDDRILECAVSGNADLIVSGDRHLTKLKRFQGIGIVRPVDFLRTLGRERMQRFTVPIL
jgi:putative PIN family toxin of toxin-antitoxin system